MKSWLIDACPLVIIISCFVLMGLGIDGEVKSIAAMAGAWIFRGAWDKRREHGT